MELKVGMYVRTKKGIYKINHFINNIYTQKFTYIDNQGISNILDEEEIIKASHNIIDLIEVGDYVNGHQVYEVDRVCCRITLNGGDIGSEAFRLTYLRPALGKNMGIKSIITKEQFESISYKVGE